MQRMATHFVGEIRFAFDRQVHGIEMADAPAAPSAAVTIALEGALSGVPSTPVLPIASSSSHRQARPQPIAALSEYAPQAFSVLEERSPRPGVRRLQPCAAPRPPRRYRLTPADRTGRVPFPRKHGVAMPRTDRRRFPVLYRGIHLGDSSEQRPPRSYATRVDPAPCSWQSCLWRLPWPRAAASPPTRTRPATSLDPRKRNPGTTTPSAPSISRPAE